MARPNTPEGLSRHGFTFQQVREWREKEFKAGRASGLDDFYRAHGICIECGGHGKLVLGVRWRDGKGVERSEKGPISSLVQHYGLDDPKNWLTRELKWDYLYAKCNSCNGIGHSIRSQLPARG